MPQPELSKSDNMVLTAYAASGNGIFCMVAVVPTKALLSQHTQNTFIWSLMALLLLGNIFLTLWIRKRNRVLFRNQLLITGLCLPFAFAVDKLYDCFAE